MAAAPDLNDYYYFVQSVDHGGFSATERALDVPKSTLSRRLIALESRLGVRLIERNSRRFVLTDVGREVYRHAQAMLIEAEAAEEAVIHRLAEPSGTVRLTCSIGMAPFLAGPLARFLAAHPKVNLVQVATNRYVDIVEEGFDIGIRGHSQPLPDSELVQRRLAVVQWHVFAAPAYLERNGMPEEPQDLAGHAALALGGQSDEVAWHFHANDGEEVVVSVVPRFRSDDLGTLKVAAMEGLGLVTLPAYVARDDAAADRLVRVLSDWATESDAEITLLTPSRRGQLPSVRALVDFLATEFPEIVSAV
jgi:DNA-binding transcriptional LysR family regulator